MPARSKAQQAAAGIALSARRGERPMSSLQGPAAAMAQMPMKSLHHFAKTKTKKLPGHVKPKGILAR